MVSHTGKRRSAVEGKRRGCLVTERGKYRGQLGMGRGWVWTRQGRLGQAGEGGGDGGCVVSRQVRVGAGKVCLEIRKGRGRPF
jgi:hypothetical protein